AFPDDCQSGRRAIRARPPREALLPAQPEGQGGAHERDQARVAGSGLGTRVLNLPHGRAAPARTRESGLESRAQSPKPDRFTMVRVRAMRTLENAVRRWGFYRVAGCDEVGRGCLAGPVMAAAVILDPDQYIAAASIVAKVTRDRQMMTHHAADPRYGYDRHKGYATADHLAAVARYGYSSLHRRSFRPPSLFDTMD